jgi:hypothetical protein
VSFAARALEVGPHLLAIFIGRATATPLRLATLHISRYVTRRADATGPQTEAANRPCELASLPGVVAIGLPAQCLPAVEERLGLFAGPAQRVEHVSLSSRDGVTKVLNGEVCGVAGVGKILVAPLHLPPFLLAAEIGSVGPRRALATSPGTSVCFTAALRLAIAPLRSRLITTLRLLASRNRPRLTVGRFAGLCACLLCGRFTTCFGSGFRITARRTVLANRLTAIA